MPDINFLLPSLSVTITGPHKETELERRKRTMFNVVPISESSLIQLKTAPESVEPARPKGERAISRYFG